eukprot:3187130-Pleurochrysis_carterae.AAC.2
MHAGMPAQASNTPTRAHMRTFAYVRKLSAARSHPHIRIRMFTLARSLSHVHSRMLTLARSRTHAHKRTLKVVVTLQAEQVSFTLARSRFAC